jgi:outer membrane receptor protein involved in Fe transport
MFKRALLTLACVLAISAPGFAQEQTGTIEGVVKDSSGAILPGVTVELTNVTRAAVAGTATTDASGNYRFVGLLPGKYEAVAKLQGFSPAKVENIQLSLGKVLRVELALSVGNMSETVQVTAESPILDTKQSARGTSIRSEQIELVPHGRDFSSLVTQAPGANNETKLGGISIDGASAGENRWIIDGIETTNLQSGVSGKNVIADFVEEVQVKSSGYTAEYGGAMGGVINVQTKSGTNVLHGAALFNFQGDKTEAGFNPTLRTNLTNSDAAEYITYPEDEYTRVEPGIALGGPLVKDKAWFFGAYQPAMTKTTRSVSPSSAQNPAAASVNTTQKETYQYITANQTAQISNSLRTRVAYNNSFRSLDGLLPAQTGLDPAGTNYKKKSDFPNWSLSGNADWVASSKFVMGFRGGYYNADQSDSNVTEEPQVVFVGTNNIGFLDVPASLQHGTGFLSIPTNQKVERDQQTRAFAQADATLYANFAGQHQFKMGVQFDRVGNNVLRGNARPVVRIRWNTPLSGVRGKYGYYEVRSNDVDPSKGIITEGNIHTDNVGFFFQDSWTIGSRLTVNVGIRTEKEEVPTYTTGLDANGEPIPSTAIKFGFADKFAPRAGFAYDILGDGKWKLYGSWGRFYDIFKLELPRGSFGGDKWISYYYTLDTYDWPNLVTSGCPTSCPGTFLRSTNFRLPSFGEDALEPDLKPMQQQEFTLGLDKELSPIMAVSVRYVHKNLIRIIEDTGFLTPTGDEGYVIANPAEGLTKYAYTDPLVNMPKPQRDYDSVELAFEKRFADQWFMRTSYSWSRLYGNSSGLSQSDENGRTSPNVGRSYDYPAMMFDEHGQPVYGPLATDRPHQWKTQFIYAFNFGTSVGASEYVASGLPVTRELGILPTSNYPVNYLGRLSDGRTEMYSQTDAYIQHEWKFGGDKRLQLSLNVLNLFDQRAGVSKASTYQKTDGISFDEADFYAGKLNFEQLIQAQGIKINPQFLKYNGYQAPLAARFGVKFLF